MSSNVVAVHAGDIHAFSKSTVDGIRLVEGWGVEGDVHAGVTVKHRSRVAADPSQPNLRQVHLIHVELLDTLAAAGFEVRPGQLGENITTRGVDLPGLPVGTRMTVGGATVTVTGLRNPCRQIDAFRPGLLKQLVRTGGDGVVERLAGVMSVVSRSGSVRGGDPVTIALPPGPHRRLTRV
ncbi:MAG: MOSC domain-containing protein [Phycicoccus sp.]